MKDCNDAHDCQRTQCDLNFDDINEAMERRKRSIAASNGKLYLSCSGQLSCPYLMFLFFWRGCNVSFRISCCSQAVVSGVSNADRVFRWRQHASALFEIDARWDIGHPDNQWKRRHCVYYLEPRTDVKMIRNRCADPRGHQSQRPAMPTSCIGRILN